jgi:fibronectin-binding autotransporter adhesin
LAELQNVVNRNVVGLTNPGLARLSNYGGPTPTMALLPGSPAIGAGTTGADIPAADQRGEPRTGAQDIGAFQSQGFELRMTASSSPQQTTVGTPFAKPVRIYVVPNNPIEPVAGGTISFSVPTTGASAVISSGASATIPDEIVAVTAVANVTAGSYVVTASTPDAAPIKIKLSNTATNS